MKNGIASFLFFGYNWMSKLESVGYDLLGSMKNINLLVFITQLGLSVVVPLGGFILLAVWLKQRFEWGGWVVVVGVLVGIACAAEGLRSTLKVMSAMGKDKKEVQPPVAFNDHE